MIYKFRGLLIQIGKFLPFVVCFIVLINYAEVVIALALDDFLDWNSVFVPNTRLSFLIGSYIEYNITHLAVLIVLSFAIETCIYNKLACAYLGLNLFEKSYFDFEVEPTYIYAICTANIFVCIFLIYKGLSRFNKS